MKKILLLGAFLITTILTGCSVLSSTNPNLSSAPVDYKMEIIKSEANRNTPEFKAKQNSTGKELLVQSGVNYEMSGEEITSLDKVISTLSKNWNLYINDTKIDFNTPINSQSKIEWKYEARNT
ncbi:MAG: hypothetical protein WA057_00370 [Candidatus Magasanikiibacteriota bacterium]